MLLAARQGAVRAILFTPLLLSTLAATGIFLNQFLSGWQLMWTFAVVVYFFFKTLSVARIDSPAKTRKLALYFLAWPNMDAASYFNQAQSRIPGVQDWLRALIGTGFGAFAVFVCAEAIAPFSPLAAGWVGFGGIICLLHFGLFSLMALAWQQKQHNALPIMNAPYKAHSVAEFWSRWNLAFHQIVHPYVFKPTARVLGINAATFITFLFSGLLHDLILSLPAGGGYGLPTLYFLIQWCAIVMERSISGKRVLAGRKGRLFAAIIVIGPVPLLFHEPFIVQVILPFLNAIGAL